MHNMHKVDIGGVIFGNISTITPEIVYEYYHNVTARSGKLYQKIRYKKTNQTIVFYNILDGVYESIKAIVNSSQNRPITVGIPNESGGFDYADYRMTITDEVYKGYIRENEYVKLTATVYLEKVIADE